MILKEFQGLRWHEFELLSDLPLTHATFTRHGGTSSGHLAHLNLGCKVGDLEGCLIQNYSKASNALNMPAFSIGNLSHGKEIKAIEKSELQDTQADGLSTKNPALGLFITHADCQAAIFYDPVNHAIANVHCGWRGNVQNIYAAAVNHMKSRYHSKPENLLVCLSPSLGPEHAEFLNYRTELPEPFWEHQVKPFYFDLWSISQMQLVRAGVLSHHIQNACIDTYACSEDYFSYRRCNMTGRQATVCALNP